MSAPSPARSSLAANLALGAAALLVSLALFEGACQVLARVWIFPGFDRDMARSNFFIAPSDDPVLAYEMKPGFSEVHDGKTLRINRFGLRADSDDLFEGRRKIAVLGDSVTMSAGHSQERALPALLEARLRADGRDAVVLNFGVPGYSTRELLEFLRRKDAIYHVDHVLYLLNPNDFARRDSVYEGADNGLYRMFARPTWQTPWFLRKAVYRLVKGDRLVSMRWYRWLFAGNEQRAQADILEMARYCKAEGAGFSVALLPSGEAYGGAEGYALSDMYERLAEFLDGAGIARLSPIAELGADPTRYFDASDHLQDAGNERMAELLHAFLAENGAFGERGYGAAPTGSGSNSPSVSRPTTAGSKDASRTRR